MTATVAGTESSSTMANVELHKEPVFGLSITPYSSNLENIFKLAKTADDLGLDIIGIQDHPYNGSFFDTWTLISTLAASTRRIRYFPDVSDLPMRPPAILAKTAATLDIITKGRIELGLGTGAFWDAIQSWGGSRRTPREAVAAYKEALQVIRLIWNYGHGRSRVSFPGKYYHLEDAQAGPSPYHKMSIWIGAIDEREGSEKSNKKPFFLHDKKPFIGSVSHWVDWLTSSYKELGLDTFIFWPSVEGDEENQIRTFAQQIVPKLRVSLKESK